MQNTFISGPNHSEPAETHKDKDGRVGAVVYSEARREWTQRTILFLNDEGSRDMNVNGSSAGTPDNIHNGTDDIYWAASNIIGTKMTANSADRSYDGTLSVKIDNPSLNDVWEFDKGSDVTVANFESISMWVNVDKDWSTGDSVSFYGWDSATASVIGNEILLENYIAEIDTDIWQKAIIPLAAMGLTSGTIDGFRMSLIGKGAGKAPKFYLDVMRIEETAGISFTAEPAEGKVFEYDRVELYFEDAYDSTLPSGTMPNLSLTKILGISPTIGFSFQRFELDQPEVSLAFKNLSDLMSLTFRVVDVGGDGTNTYLKMESVLPVPTRMTEAHSDRVVITVNDDFSGLLNFRALLIGKELVV